MPFRKYDEAIDYAIVNALDKNNLRYVALYLTVSAKLTRNKLSHFTFTKHLRRLAHWKVIKKKQSRHGEYILGEDAKRQNQMGILMVTSNQAIVMEAVAMILLRFAEVHDSPHVYKSGLSPDELLRDVYEQGHWFIDLHQNPLTRFALIPKNSIRYTYENIESALAALERCGLVKRMTLEGRRVNIYALASRRLANLLRDIRIAKLLTNEVVCHRMILHEAGDSELHQFAFINGVEFAHAKAIECEDEKNHLRIAKSYRKWRTAQNKKCIDCGVWSKLVSEHVHAMVIRHAGFTNDFSYLGTIFQRMCPEFAELAFSGPLFADSERG